MGGIIGIEWTKNQEEKDESGEWSGEWSGERAEEILVFSNAEYSSSCNTSFTLIWV